MTPFQYLLAAGAFGTFVVIYQNILTFQPTQVDLEDRLRDRLVGKGDVDGRISAKVDTIRVTPLSRRGKLKWYFKQGIDSSVEVWVETNVLIEDEVWDGIEEVVADTAEVEHLETEVNEQKQTARSAIRIDTTDESEIMQVVCAIPYIINELDWDVEPRLEQSPPLSSSPAAFEEMLGNLE